MKRNLRKMVLPFLAAFFVVNLYAQETMQEKVPYASVPDAPDSLTPGAVVGRMLDGLGFRYHWATRDLREEDLHYQPEGDGRTIAETMVHVYDLSLVILKFARQKDNRGTSPKPVDMAEIRKLTLRHLEEASGIFKSTPDLSRYPIVSGRGEKRSGPPFWNMINGPIEDAVWHAGQIVLLRRMAGNPINPKLNFMAGKLRE